MSLKQVLVHDHKLEQTQKLSLEQTQEIRLSLEKLLAQTLRQDKIIDDMIHTFRDKRLNPNATCFKCGYSLNSSEILNGFLNDPHIIKTTCPKCGYTFTPNLTSRDDIGSISLIYYCPQQTLEVFSNCSEMNPQELEKYNPSAYYSGIKHFGTMKNMFKELNIKYLFKEKTKMEKVHPFLGKISDYKISKYSGLSCSSIGRERRKLNIPKFKKSTVEDIAEEHDVSFNQVNYIKRNMT